MDVKRTYSVDTKLTAQKVCQLLNNGKINDLPLQSQFTPGSSTQVNSAISQYIAATLIDATHVLVIYSNNTSGNYLWGVILTINNNNTINVGTPININSVNSVQIAVAMLDTTHAIVCYRNDTVSSYLWGVVLTISGDSFIVGTLTQINSYTSTYNTISVLDSTHVVITYQNGSGAYSTYAGVLTISGATITIGTNTNVWGNNSYSHKSLPLDSTHVLITFTATNNMYVYAMVLIISGNSITTGTALQIDTRLNCYYLDVVKINDGTIFLTYQCQNESYNMYGVLLFINGTTITKGDISYITKATGNMVSVIKFDNEQLAIFYNTNYLYMVSLKIINNIINVGSVTLLHNALATYVSVVTLDSNHAIVNYEDGGNNSYVSSIIVSYNNNTGKSIGITQDSNGTILLKGISKGHVNLVPGALYYYDDLGNISTNNEGTFLGIAVTATNLLVPDYIIS